MSVGRATCPARTYATAAAVILVSYPAPTFPAPSFQLMTDLASAEEAGRKETPHFGRRLRRRSIFSFQA